jgi:hypothetical protein
VSAPDLKSHLRGMPTPELLDLPEADGAPGGWAGEPMSLRAVRAAAKDVPRFPDGTVLVLCTKEVEPAVLALPNFMPVEQYRTMKPKTPEEIGVVEIFRFERTDAFEPGAWVVYHPEPGY